MMVWLVPVKYGMFEISCLTSDTKDHVTCKPYKMEVNFTKYSKICMLSNLLSVWILFKFVNCTTVIKYACKNSINKFH